MANEIQELKFQVGEVWKGVYSSSTPYSLANVVQDTTGLSIYRSLKSGNVGHPVSDASWWFRIIDMSSIKTESDRIMALNDAIADDEALRVAAEELRQQHEAERVAAEIQRNEAEQARINTEQQRVTKETQREANEQQRINVEQGRVSAESARVQAEQARALAETLRANAEDHRAANEQNRVAAEQQRIERAEQDHQRAESDHAAYVDSLGAFDISSYHAIDGVLAKYADLTDAIGIGGANIPDTLRKGGMSVKFVQSSDNKYVQYMYHGISTAVADFKNVANWEKVNLEDELNNLEYEVFGEYQNTFTQSQPTITGLNIPKGTLTIKITNNHTSYASYIKLSLYDKDDNLLEENVGGSIAAGSTGTYSVIINQNLAKIIYTTNNNNVSTTLSVESAGAIIPEITALKEQDSTLSQAISDLNDALSDESRKLFQIQEIPNKVKKSFEEGGNIIDFSECEIGKCFNVDGDILPSNSLALSNYINVKSGDSIIAHCFNHESYSSYVVYDISGEIIRSVTQNNQYTYQNGDAYVRFCFNGKTIQDCRANYGITLSAYKKYQPLYSYLEDTENEIVTNKADVDSVIKKTVTINRATQDPSWRLNGTTRLTALKIDEYGNLTAGNSGLSTKGSLLFLDSRIGKVNIKAKPYQNSNSTALYAFYNSETIFDSTTCVGVGPQVSGYDLDTKEYKDVTVPSGTKALVVGSYSFDADYYGVSGTIMIDKEVQVDKDEFDSLADNISLKEVSSGERKYYVRTTDFDNANSGIRSGGGYADVAHNIMRFSCLSDGTTVNQWAYSPSFNPDDHFVHIKFGLKYISAKKTVSIALAKGTGGISFVQTIGTCNEDGEYEFTFDPTYFRIYKEMSDTFYIWIQCAGVVGGVDILISDFKIFSNVDEETMSVIEGNNAREMFKSTDENLASIKKTLDNPTFLMAPNGDKYELAVNNSGQIVALPVIPSKCAMFGNSLIAGNYSNGSISPAFGMCATDKDKDYYALINAFCLTLNPSYTAKRCYCVDFERISSLSNAESTINTVLNQLDGDEDLVIIQAGDNVDAASEQNIWPTTTMMFAQAVRAKCPNARICWPAIWYATAGKMNSVRNACAKWGITFIDIADLNVAANLEPIGGLIDFGSVGTDVWTLENVSNLVDNGNNNITVTFTYNDTTATTTLDVASFSLSGTTLTYTGRYKIITLQAGHPGDRGFKAISNRVIYKMGMTDDEEYYSLD